MQKGKTVACPACRKILFREAEFDGTGTLTIKCVHCTEMVVIEITKKSSIKVKIFLPILIAALLIIPVYELIKINHIQDNLATLSERVQQ